MSDNETPPIVAPKSMVTADQVEQPIRAALLVVTAGGAILGFAQKHDLVGLINYLQSGAAVPAVLVVISAATWARGFWKTRVRATQLHNVAADPRVPDAVARTTA